MEKWLTEVEALAQRKAPEYPSLDEAAQRLRRRNHRLNPELALRLARWGMKPTPKGKWVWKFDPLHRTAAPHPFYTPHALEFLRPKMGIGAQLILSGSCLGLLKARYCDENLNLEQNLLPY